MGDDLESFSTETAKALAQKMDHFTDEAKLFYDLIDNILGKNLVIPGSEGACFMLLISNRYVLEVFN